MTTDEAARSSPPTTSTSASAPTGGSIPSRVMAVIAEIGADVIALQETDRRFGDRAGLLDLAALARDDRAGAGAGEERPLAATAGTATWCWCARARCASCTR